MGTIILSFVIGAVIGVLVAYLIANRRYEASTAVLDEMKRRVLGEYNMFEYAARLCDQLNPDAPKLQVTIQPCQSGLNWQNFMNYTIRNNYYKLLTKYHYWKNGETL